MSAGIQPAATAAPAPQPKAPPKSKPHEDPGVWAGIWHDTLGPVFEHATALKQEIAKDPSLTHVLHMGIREGLENTPPAMLEKVLAHVISGAYEQGKKAVQHGKEAVRHEGEGISALAKGDMQRAGDEGAAATGEMSTAAGHGLAAVVPGFGPAAADIGEEVTNKPKYAAGRAATQLATAGAGSILKGVTGAAGKVGEAIEGGAAREAALADATGEATQAEGNVNVATERVAQQERRLAEMSQRHAVEEGANKGAVAEAREGMNATQDRIANTRTAQAAERDTLKVTGQQEARAAAAEKQAGAQKAAQSTVKDIATEAANKHSLGGQVARVNSFGEAAEFVEETAKPIYQKLDAVTNGEFSSLRDSIKQAKKQIYEGKTAEASIEGRQQLGILEKEMDKLFERNSAEISKDDLKLANGAWRSAKVLDAINDAVEGAFNVRPAAVAERAGIERTVSGTKLQNRLGKLLDEIPLDQMETVIGKEGVDNLYRVADMTSTAKKAAQFQAMTEEVAKKIIEVRKRQAAELATLKSQRGAQRKVANEAVAKQQANTTEMQFAKGKGDELSADLKAAKSGLSGAKQRVTELTPKKPDLVDRIVRKSIVSGAGAVAGHATGIGATAGTVAALTLEQAVKHVMGKAMTNPRVGKMLADAAKSGATPKVYAPLIARTIEMAAEEQQPKEKK